MVSATAEVVKCAHGNPHFCGLCRGDVSRAGQTIAEKPWPEHARLAERGRGLLDDDATGESPQSEHMIEVLTLHGPARCGHIDGLQAVIDGEMRANLPCATCCDQPGLVVAFVPPVQTFEAWMLSGPTRLRQVGVVREGWFARRWDAEGWSTKMLEWSRWVQ